MKKILSWLLSVMILLGISGDYTTVKAQGVLTEGNYVYFGQYNGQPILWRVIHLDEEGDPLLFAEKIITYKAFDAAEAAQFSQDPGRQTSGSNRWSNSNIREWLNSESPFVTYTTSAPTGEGVLDGYNAYEKEAGFLYNFESKDREAVKPVLHKALLPQIDESFFDGGSQLHNFTNTSAKDSVANYEEAYFEQVQDLVFLLSVKELANHVEARGWSYNKTATPEALAKDESGLAKDSLGSYWVGTPSAVNEEFVRYVYDGSFVYYTLANDGSFGICPALYIDLDLIQLKSGAGTAENPYTIVGINEPITIQDANLEAAIRQTIDQPSGDIMLSEVLGITQLDASGRQIESLEGIEKLANLEILDISYNKVTDVTPLRYLKKLKILYAQYNEIEEFQNMFYNDDIANSSLQEMNVAGNNTTSASAQLEASGINLISEEEAETNQGIDTIVQGSEGKTKEQIMTEVNQVVRAAGFLNLPATGNAITLTSELLKVPAEAAMKVSKQAEKTLIQKDMSLNRTIKSTVDIAVTGIDYASEFSIILDPTILEINQADEITIQTDKFSLSLFPQKLIEDFKTTQSISIIVKSSNETQEVVTLDDLSASTNMGQFAQQVRNLSETVVREKVSETAQEEVLYNGLLKKENKNLELYTLSFEKDGNGVEQLESYVTLGLNVIKDAYWDCVFRRDSEGTIETVGGQYDIDQQKIALSTSKTGQYYVLKNNQFYRDLEGLTEEEKVAIQVLSAKGFLAARTEREFVPEEPINRAELAAAIVKMTYLYNENAECDFSDINRLDPYYHYIASSQEKGIVNGYPDNTFKPENAINNNEIVKISAAILAYSGYIYPRDSSTYITFSNKADIKPWVNDYLGLLMREEGFIDSQQQYEGEAVITRKEAALLLYKLYEKL